MGSDVTQTLLRSINRLDRSDPPWSGDLRSVGIHLRLENFGTVLLRRAVVVSSLLDQLKRLADQYALALFTIQGCFEGTIFAESDSDSAIVRKLLSHMNAKANRLSSRVFIESSCP